MKTKLDYYKVFYETARHSSFSTAAQSLYISQSAISQCISQLEEDLGTKLFIRSRRGVTLTKEGLL
ncbi:MAG: LysR family transcriptional regulator, partial [Clostridia bacterium]|nr:LysR family transcriptional regulator [Clostridia bacterium]